MLPSCCPARAAASGTGQGRRAIVTRGHRVATWHCSPYLYTFYGKEHVEYRTKDRVSSYVGLRCGIRVIPYTCVKRLVSTALQLTVYFQSSDERRDPGETQSQIRARRGRPRPISEVSASRRLRTCRNLGTHCGARGSLRTTRDGVHRCIYIPL